MEGGGVEGEGGQKEKTGDNQDATTTKTQTLSQMFLELHTSAMNAFNQNDNKK